jgi:hypothetical protein
MALCAALKTSKDDSGGGSSFLAIAASIGRKVNTFDIGPRRAGLPPLIAVVS